MVKAGYEKALKTAFAVFFLASFASPNQIFFSIEASGTDLCLMTQNKAQITCNSTQYVNVSGTADPILFLVPNPLFKKGNTRMEENWVDLIDRGFDPLFMALAVFLPIILIMAVAAWLMFKFVK